MSDNKRKSGNKAQSELQAAISKCQKNRNMKCGRCEFRTVCILLNDSPNEKETETQS